MRDQSPELVEKRIAPLRGRPISEERKKHISQCVSQAWKEGRYVGVGASPEQMRRLVAMRDMPKLKEMNRQRLLGTHGQGRGAEHNPNHHKCLYWIIRDPRGVTYEFNNLSSWCKKNEHRFLPDDRPMSKIPLWRRAIGGFNNMQRTDRKGQHQWKGWTLVSVLERKEMGAPDLLGRDQAVCL